ncbi:hypothetical protein ACU8KH_03975 [Lachancea thermotolerans]
MTKAENTGVLGRKRDKYKKVKREHQSNFTTREDSKPLSDTSQINRRYSMPSRLSMCRAKCVISLAAQRRKLGRAGFNKLVSQRTLEPQGGVITIAFSDLRLNLLGAMINSLGLLFT